ncbi:MAG: hypothetical protein GY818_16535 [Planctomycetaceae bacterium]|nr:hypothetical protein [Planctomycetaceae bacterium]
MYKKFVIIGLVFLNATGLHAGNAIPKYDEIPVVKTWSELREVPVFAKRDFGIVRLGLEQNIGLRRCDRSLGLSSAVKV